jgi:hypothetical protein
MRDIVDARSHREAFLLIGKMRTGKNIFIELVAQGEPGRGHSMPCIDENIDGTADQPLMLDKFFGPDGVVDRNRDALIHFDLLQNATAWPLFLAKLHELARTHTLHRTDNVTLTDLPARVVVGATVELAPYIAVNQATELGYLYGFLESKPIARTHSLESRVARMPQLLSELLATSVLAPSSDIDEEQATRLGWISDAELDALKSHSWPGEFSELAALVHRALRLGTWSQAIVERIPARVFVIWSRHNETEARVLNSMLNAAGIPTFFSPTSMGAGEWWPQVSWELASVGFVVFCLTRRVFDVDVEGVAIREMRKAIERSHAMNRPFIFPVALDGCRPEHLTPSTPNQKSMVESLTSVQWFWVDHRNGLGFTELLDEIRGQMSLLRREQLSR